MKLLIHDAAVAHMMDSRGIEIHTPFINIVLFSSAVLDPRVGHTMEILSPFISVLCHSD